QALSAPVALTERPWTLRFSEDGRWLACLSGQRVWVMDTVTFARGREFPVGSTSIAFVGNGEHLITDEYDDAPPRVFDFLTGAGCGSPFGQPQFDWSRNASLAALRFSRVSGDRLTLLDSSTGQPQLEPFFHDGWIVSRTLHPNGRIAATGSQDRTVRLWS